MRLWQLFSLQSSIFLIIFEPASVQLDDADEIHLIIFVSVDQICTRIMNTTSRHVHDRYGRILAYVGERCRFLFQRFDP